MIPPKLLHAFAWSTGALVLLVVLPPTALAEGEYEECDVLWCCYETPFEVVQRVGEDVKSFVDDLVEQWQLVAGKAKCTVLEVLGICSDEGVPGVNQPNWITVTGSTGPLHARRDRCAEYFLPGRGPIEQPFCTLPNFYLLHEQWSATPHTPAGHQHTCRAIGT